MSRATLWRRFFDIYENADKNVQIIKLADELSGSAADKAGEQYDRLMMALPYTSIENKRETGRQLAAGFLYAQRLAPVLIFRLAEACAAEDEHSAEKLNCAELFAEERSGYDQGGERINQLISAEVCAGSFCSAEKYM